jgi:hypothetical protein
MQDLHICRNFGKREIEIKSFLTEVAPAEADAWGPSVSTGEGNCAKKVLRLAATKKIRTPDLLG